jgi:hypothetical protein
MKQVSNFLSLNAKDFLKGFITAVLTVIITGVSTALSAVPPQFPDLATLEHLGLIGLGAGLAYIVKNWLTNSKDQFLTKEVPTAK